MNSRNTRFPGLQLPIILLLFLLAFQLMGRAQQPDGKYTERYENNKLRVKGRYSNGQKTGNWFYYAPGGILQKRERWSSSGRLKLTFLYNERGRLASITNDKGVTTYKPGCGCQ